MELIEYLQKKADFTYLEAQDLAKLYDYKELPKKQLLFSEGYQPKKNIYIEQGLLRLYYIREGKDITHDFFVEENFFIPIGNLFLNEYFPFYLEALEDSKIWTINYSTYSQQLVSNTKLQKLDHQIQATAIIDLSNHLYSVQFQSAEERYNHLINRYPNILLRVPLGHIASYLGITQQTLSVIRSGKKK